MLGKHRKRFPNLQVMSQYITKEVTLNFLPGFFDFENSLFNCSEAERFLNIIFCIIALEGDKSGLDRRTK